MCTPQMYVCVCLCICLVFSVQSSLHKLDLCVQTDHTQQDLYHFCIHVCDSCHVYSERQYICLHFITGVSFLKEIYMTFLSFVISQPVVPCFWGFSWKLLKYLKSTRCITLQPERIVLILFQTAIWQSCNPALCTD